MHIFCAEEFVVSIDWFIYNIVRVRLIASVPGRHVGQQKMRWGHLKLRQVRGKNLYL